MDPHIRRPEEILAYRPLRRILGSEPWALWTVGPADSVLAALRIMADKNIGFLLVLERGAMVGVLSERDCVRRVVLAGRSLEATPWFLAATVSELDEIACLSHMCQLSQ